MQNRSRQTMRGIFSKKSIVIGIVILALTALVVMRIIQASAEVESPPDVEEIRRQSGVPVEVAVVEEAPFEVRRQFTGTLRGIRSASIRARTADEILEIPVRVGQRVREGDVLVRQSAETSMASVRQAEAAYEQAHRTVERLRPLRERGAISEQDWDGALTALRVAEANVEAARRAVVLTSPISGVVTDVLVTPGSFPGVGDVLVQISDLSRVHVLLQVSQEQSREIARGQEAILQAHGLRGEVTRIALQADPETRLIEVELTFPGAAPGGAGGASGTPGSPAPRAAVVPGTLVQAEVIVGRRESALAVPRVAFRNGTVWVVDEEGIAHLRPVEVGLMGRDRAEILGGLQAGERVVVAGASLLSDGIRTRVVGG
jgi:membrane fusion protein, multidrug efflux system